jgi:hypothetical protein
MGSVLPKPLVIRIFASIPHQITGRPELRFPRNDEGMTRTDVTPDNLTQLAQAQLTAREAFGCGFQFIRPGCG